VSLSLESTIARSPDVLHSDLGDQAVMMDVDAGAYFGLNEVGTRIWALAEEPVSLTIVVDRLTAEYDVARDECEAAVLESLDSSTRRELEETGITGIYLLSFRHWLSDDSVRSESTRQLLSRLLNRAEKLGGLIFGPRNTISGRSTTSEFSKTHRHSNAGDEAALH